MVDCENTKMALGTLILSCQPRPVKDYIVEIENNRFFYYFSPFIMGVLGVTIFVFYLACMCLGKTGPLINDPLWLVFFVFFVCAGLAWGAWWNYVSPNNDCLVIHQNGFRWKVKFMTWKYFPSSGVVLFDELDRIDIRPDFAEPDFACDKKASKQEKTANFIVDLFYSKGDLRLTMKNGRRKTLENIMKRFVAEDLHHFIEYIQTHHSRLVTADTSAESEAIGTEKEKGTF